MRNDNFGAAEDFYPVLYHMEKLARQFLLSDRV